jgi:sortase A
MQPFPADRDTRRTGLVRLWIERLLIVVGLAALLWCAAVIADATLAQRRARVSLAAAGRQEAPASTQVVVGTSGADLIAEPATRQAGAAIAELSIPRINLSAAVLQGSDERTLGRGPGHLEHTAMPGEPGNVVIAGHRDSFFLPLRNIRVGDEILLRTPAARFRYQVTAFWIVDPSDVGVLSQTDESTLTLITCYPFTFIGGAPERFVVRAVRVRTDRPLPARAAADDQALVRQAVARFAEAYSVRLIREGHAVDAAPLRVASCEVAIEGYSATVICDGAAQSSAAEGPMRTFRLERGEAGWTISAVVSD